MAENQGQGYVVLPEGSSRTSGRTIQMQKIFVAGAVAAGAVDGKDFVTILDRKEAITHALKIAQPGDVIILTGKGSEETGLGKSISLVRCR